jgi:hypothetical protein
MLKLTLASFTPPQFQGGPYQHSQYPGLFLVVVLGAGLGLTLAVATVTLSAHRSVGENVTGISSPQRQDEAVKLEEGRLSHQGNEYGRDSKNGKTSVDECRQDVVAKIVVVEALAAEADPVKVREGVLCRPLQDPCTNIIVKAISKEIKNLHFDPSAAMKRLTKMWLSNAKFGQERNPFNVYLVSSEPML